LASRHPLDQPSAAHHVVRRLREQIRGGALPPGSRLAIAELAEHHGLRRLVLAEALHRLIDQGLLVRHGGTALVTSLDPAELADISHLRREVGLLLSEQSHRCMSAAELDRAEYWLITATRPALVDPAGDPGGNAAIWVRAMCEFNLRLSRPGSTVPELQAFSHILQAYWRYKTLGWATIFQNNSAGSALALRREHLGRWLDLIASFRRPSPKAVRDACARHEHDGYSIASASLTLEHTASPAGSGRTAGYRSSRVRHLRLV
jgi:DNA-binding transcriptional regulator YhcF (GntR family)